MLIDDQARLDRSLQDALKITRRLSRCANDHRAFYAALALVRTLRKLGAKEKPEGLAPSYYPDGGPCDCQTPMIEWVIK